MNQSFAISLGQFLSFLALGIAVAFGLFFCVEAIVKWFRRWGKWREARRLVRQAEDSEAMKAYRAGDTGMVPPETVKAWRAGSTGAEVLREMRQLNDLMGGKK